MSQMTRSCVLACRFNSDLVANERPQPSKVQGKGRSVRWLRLICTSHSDFLTKRLPHLLLTIYNSLLWTTIGFVMHVNILLVQL